MFLAINKLGCRALSALSPPPQKKRLKNFNIHIWGSKIEILDITIQMQMIVIVHNTRKS